MQYLLMVLLLFTAVFLIVLVLIQKGKGGGLAGAFGGMGGQSAFGTKAGDLFTRITIGLAAFWILLCLFSVWFLSPRTLLNDRLGGAAQGLTAPASTDKGKTPATEKAPAEKSGEADKPAEKAADTNSTAPSDGK